MRHAWTAGKIVRGVPSILEPPEPHAIASAIDKIPPPSNLSWRIINCPGNAVNQLRLSPVGKDKDPNLWCPHQMVKMVPISPETSETVNDQK